MSYLDNIVEKTYDYPEWIDRWIDYRTGQGVAPTQCNGYLLALDVLTLAAIGAGFRDITFTGKYNFSIMSNESSIKVNAGGATIAEYLISTAPILKKMLIADNLADATKDTAVLERMRRYLGIIMTSPVTLPFESLLAYETVKPALEQMISKRKLLTG